MLETRTSSVRVIKVGEMASIGVPAEKGNLIKIGGKAKRNYEKAGKDNYWKGLAKMIVNLHKTTCPAKSKRDGD